MCGCKKRRAARAAWLEQRAGGGGKGGRAFGPGAGPPFRRPFAGGPFGRWGGTPRNDAPENTSRHEQPPPNDAPGPKDAEKVQLSEPRPARVSFMSGPFSGRRNSAQTGDGTNINTTSDITLPPKYTSGVAVSRLSCVEKPPARESLPPTYDAATKH